MIIYDILVRLYAFELCFDSAIVLGTITTHNVTEIGYIIETKSKVIFISKFGINFDIYW